MNAIDDLTASDQSLQSILDNPLASPDQRAEALALKGRNAKVRGRRLWDGKDEKDRRASTLRSALFFDAQRLYSEAFKHGDVKLQRAGLDQL